MSDIIFFKGVKRVQFSIGHVLEIMMKYAVGNVLFPTSAREPAKNFRCLGHQTQDMQ